MGPFDFRFPARIVGGPGAVNGLGSLARDLRASRVLLISRGSTASAEARIVSILRDAGLSVVDDGDEAADLVLTLGAEPRGEPVSNVPGRPAIHVPILASGGVPASPHPPGGEGLADVVVLDHELSAGIPRDELAGAMIDATACAIEAWVSTRRTVMSDWCAREAWRQLAASVPRLLSGSDDAESMGPALLGWFLAGAAARQATLGAVHACARPVSRRYGVPHATALALLLPEVVRWNSRVVADRYAELAAVRGEARRPETLVARLEDMVAAGPFPERLAAAGVVERELPTLAVEASADQVCEFTPRKFDVAGALQLYAAAY